MVLEFSEQDPGTPTAGAIIVMKMLFVLTNLENNNGHQKQPSLSLCVFALHPLKLLAKQQWKTTMEVIAKKNQRIQGPKIKSQVVKN